MLQGQESAGAPRCYFCARTLVESEVRKTEYDVGHGYRVFVMICPVCRKKKERNEGPFAPQISAQTILGILGVIAFAVFFLGFWLPGFLDMQKKHEDFERRNQELRQKFDEKGNRQGPKF